MQLGLDALPPPSLLLESISTSIGMPVCKPRGPPFDMARVTLDMFSEPTRNAWNKPQRIHHHRERSHLVQLSMSPTSSRC